MPAAPPVWTGWVVPRRHRDGRRTTEQPETYHRGNGATILLYDADRASVLLTRQFASRWR